MSIVFVIFQIFIKLTIRKLLLYKKVTYSRNILFFNNLILVSIIYVIIFLIQCKIINKFKYDLGGIWVGSKLYI